MATWLELELNEAPQPPVQIVLPPKPQVLARDEQKFEEMRRIEDELMQENLQIIRDVAKARDIDSDHKGLGVPEEWLQSGMTREQAAKTLRVAKASWLCAKEAPVFIATSKSIVLGIVKARAAEKAAPRSLNLTVVNMQTPLPKEFEVVEVDQ